MYKRQLTTYLQALWENGFEVCSVREPAPPETMLDLPGMRDELRRPMMPVSYTHLLPGFRFVGRKPLDETLQLAYLLFLFLVLVADKLLNKLAGRCV